MYTLLAQPSTLLPVTYSLPPKAPNPPPPRKPQHVLDHYYQAAALMTDLSDTTRSAAMPAMSDAPAATSEI